VYGRPRRAFDGVSESRCR